MFHDDPVNKVIRTLIRTVLSLPANYVRPANQTNSPAGGPDEPFATVYLASSKPLGKALRTQMPDPQIPLNLLETVTSVYHVVSSVQFFRENATTLARQLKSAIESSGATDYMRAQNIGHIRTGLIMDVTNVVDTFYEERAKVDLEFYITVVAVASLATFGKFPITVKINNSSSTFEVSEP